MIPVDVLALRDLEKVMPERLAALWKEHRGGMERPLDYYRGVVLLAAQYAAVGAAQEAADVVSLVPAGYYRTVMPKVMVQDAELAQAAEQVAHIFVGTGAAQHALYTNAFVQAEARA